MKLGYILPETEMKKLIGGQKISYTKKEILKYFDITIKNLEDTIKEYKSLEVSNNYIIDIIQGLENLKKDRQEILYSNKQNYNLSIN